MSVKSKKPVPSLKSVPAEKSDLPRRVYTSQLFRTSS